MSKPNTNRNLIILFIEEVLALRKDDDEILLKHVFSLISQMCPTYIPTIKESRDGYWIGEINSWDEVLQQEIDPINTLYYLFKREKIWNKQGENTKKGLDKEVSYRFCIKLDIDEHISVHIICLPALKTVLLRSLDLINDGCNCFNPMCRCIDHQNCDCIRILWKINWCDTVEFPYIN